MSNTITIKDNPSVLAFEAKLVCSDALMRSGNWDDMNDAAQWQPVKIQEKSVRGTISNRNESSDEGHKDHAKFLKSISDANIQIVDNGALPFDTDTLKVTFTLRVLGNLVKPSACNNPDYEEKLASIISAYQEKYGFKELSKRYAKNIANGRFLWRNRISAESIEVHVLVNGEKLIFDAYSIGMRDFNDVSDKKSQADLEKLSNAIEQGLSDKTGELFSFIEVDAFVKMGQGQQVFPSQEMNMEKEGDKSKHLYKLNKGKDNEIAGMHSQKIGNALRTIDDWHLDADRVGAIAVEPFGSVTNRGVAYRNLKKGSFYTILDEWMKKDKEPSEEEQHYMMAVLIRGGVFSE